jgi:hypothetical protein
MPARRDRGFERVGGLPADQLGLPRARGRELVLDRAWRQVAGEAVARRAVARRVVRGVLEVEVDDERWIETLRPLVPRLAGRLAGQYPELRVHKFRLILDRSRPLPRPQPVEAIDRAAPPSEPRSPAKSAPHDPTSDEAPAERLTRIMERYLDRPRRP